MPQIYNTNTLSRCFKREFTLNSGYFCVISAVLLTVLAWVLLCYSHAVIASTQDSRILRISSANSVVGTDILRVLTDKFLEKHPGIEFRITGAGARTALEHARQGKADLVITHYPPDEKRFVAQGFGSLRTRIMFNEYVILGPPDDPEGLGEQTDVVDIFRMMSENAIEFTVPSRRSGIYQKIEELMSMSGVEPNWPGYIQSEISGTNNVMNAAELGIYALADISTYIIHRKQIGENLVPLYRDSAALRNYISAIVVHSRKVPGANEELAKAFVDFLVSDEIQFFIETYGKEKYGSYLYTPAAYSDPGLRAQRAEELLQLATDKNRMILVSLGLLACLFIGLVVGGFWLRRKEISRLQAMHASSAKSTFLANVSHELRTPLNAIIGFSDLLTYDEQLNKDQLEQIKEIQLAGNHLYKIINELLDLNKIESGKLDLKLEKVDLQLIVKECLALVRPVGEKHEITISSVDDSCCRLVNVFADRTRLKQIVLNLLSNAIKYNKKGGSVSAECRQISDDKVRLIIIDAGIGIPKEQLAEVFTPFNRLGAELGSVEGTGIGLTITKQLVEMMGGRIGVESEQGLGSTFWIELPVG